MLETPIICFEVLLQEREPLILIEFETEKVAPIKDLIVSPCIFVSTSPRVLEEERFPLFPWSSLILV